VKKPSLRKRLISLGGAIVLLVLLWVFLYVWTAPVGLIWHVFHGNFTTFEQHEIRVPWDMWRVSSSGTHLTLLREASKYRIINSPSGVIIVSRRPGPATDMSKEYDRIAQAIEHPPSGYKFEGLHQLTAAKGPVYCWESVTLDSTEISISCWFDKDTLAASFGGTAGYRDEFYKVIAAVSGESSRPSP
jgi:hypothetical protein